MALKKLTLRPGVNREGTSYANEDGYYISDKVRFRSGYAEKIGGWKNINDGTSTYYGIARSMIAWTSLIGEKLLGLGTTQKFYIDYGGAFYDITPIREITTLSVLPPAPISTTSGSLLVEVTDTGHGATTGTFVTLTKAYTTLSAAITASSSTPITVVSTTGFPSSGTILIDNEQINYVGTSATQLGTTGITRGANNTAPTTHSSGALVISQEAINVGGLNLQGEHEIIEKVSDNVYQIASTTPATSTATGGAGVYVIYQINAAKGAITALSGWGTGVWGGVISVPATGWGSSAVSTEINEIRLWSEATYDQDLMFAPRNGPIYWWTKNVESFPRGITLNEQANTIVKVPMVPSTWTIGGSDITVDSTDGINTGALVTGTGIPAGTYVSPAWDYSTLIPLLDSAGLPAVLGGTGAGDLSFSFAGKHIPVETLLVTTSSQNAFTIAFGATPYDPFNFSTEANFDPLLIRWSDQDNPFEWVPEVTNQSGEQRLANGSTIVAATNTRQEILVWTDTAIYSMQYLGPPYVWGINLLMDNLSIASQNAAITVNNVTYWMGVDRFYQYSGRVETLPCTLRQFIFSNINRNLLSQICCGSNEGFNEVWWFYPSADSQINDRYVIYNHLEQVWYYGTINRSAWLDTQLEQYPLGAFSTEDTYLSFAITSTDTTISVDNASSFPTTGVIIIDSEEISYAAVDYNTNILTGCIRGVNSTTAASHLQYSNVQFYTPNQLMFHEYGYDDVSNPVAVPILAHIETSDFDIDDGFNIAYGWRIIPDLSFEGSTVTNPKCYLTLKTRLNSGSAYTTVAGTASNQEVVRSSYNITSVPIEQYTGQVYVRIRGRQMAFRMESVDLGVYWQMGLMRIDLRHDGRR